MKKNRQSIKKNISFRHIIPFFPKALQNPRVFWIFPSSHRAKHILLCSDSLQPEAHWNTVKLGVVLLESPAPPPSCHWREPYVQGASCWGSKVSKGQLSSFGKWHQRNAIFAPCSILISLSNPPQSQEALGAACRSQNKGRGCFSPMAKYSPWSPADDP